MLAPGQYRPAWFRWYACGLLLLATTINYMDRMTLSTSAPQVTQELHLDNTQYGQIEACFGYCFAFGALGFGLLADYVSIRWLYPIVLVAWSIMGIATSYTESYEGLLVCRALLGLFESGHWPCALKTTQRLMSAKERTMGNSILQSGASVGAIITPQIIRLLDSPEIGAWRLPFQVIGYIGLVWAVFWLISMRDSDFQGAQEVETKSSQPSLSMSSLVRRVLVLIVVVVLINCCWQLIRAWLTKFLQEGRGYEKSFALSFVTWYYIATDVGCIAAGLGSAALQRGGLSIPFARWLVFTICACVTLLSLWAAFLPQGNLLLAMLLLIGAGALGLFPCYYTLSQQLTTRYQGTVTGLLGFAAWMISSPLQTLFGYTADIYHTFDYGIAIAGSLPLAAALFWLVVWDWGSEPASSVPQPDASSGLSADNRE
jgi:ACS family hexuronate transporter-like MFS transporter